MSMVSKKLLRIAILTIILTTLMFSMIPINVNASPTNYDVKLYFHKVSSVTLYGSTTTTTIMNTTSTGYFKSTNQTETVTCSANDTYYTLATFYLYPKLAGSLTIPSQSALSIILYLSADSSVSNVTIKFSMFKVSSTDGTTTIIGVNYTNTGRSLSTSVSSMTLAGPVIGSETTINANYYLKLVIEVMVDTEAPVDITLTYDTSSCPSRIDRLTVSDHIDITAINTYLGSVPQTDFAYSETINLTATIIDAFGAYDIASVSVYYIPFGYATHIGSDTMTLLSGTATSYTVYYYDTYTHDSSDYTGIYWVPYVTITDRSGNTLTESGDKIGISGPSGEQPQEPIIPTPDWMPDFILGIPIALFIILILTILAIICAIIGIYIYMGRGK